MLKDLPPLGLDAADATQSWYARAGVRSAPRRNVVSSADLLGKRFFPDHLVPHFRHEALRDIDEQRHRYLSAQFLFQWLDFTAHFEVSVVNRVAQRIATGTAGFDVSAASRLAAFQIYVDEGYHSLYNLDIRQQLEAASGLAALPFEFGSFLARLDSIGGNIPEYRELLQLMQVIVFETSVTSILVDIPKDDSVVKVVREVVRDHAIDEGRHHSYFAALFRSLWSQLPSAVRSTIALCLPELVVHSLAPYFKSSELALRAVGLPADVTSGVIADSYSAAASLAYVRAASARTISLFEHCGVLDTPGSEDRFREFGLLPTRQSGIIGPGRAR